MVFNTMNTIRPKPYVVRDNKGLVKRKEEDDSSKSLTSEAQKEQLNENTKSRGLEQLEGKAIQGQAAVTPAAAKRDDHINVAQILKDFRSTASAIGTPDELNEEVGGYLTLVEAQVKKENPNVKLVKSNLKNASSVLDAYITQTLQKQSNVVENWIDALFLQKINFKYNDGEVNQQFLVKFPGESEKVDEEEEVEATEEEAIQEEQAAKTQQQAKSDIPQDTQLKSMFVQAKKHVYANQPKKAMDIFQKALKRAMDVKDNETQSKICFEIGRIYDKNDYLAHALTSYNKSLETSSDKNIKTKAHYSMAQIYDDVKQFEPAINHYYSSIAYAGETNNPSAQSTSMTKIANILADRYNKEAFTYFSEASSLADETKDSKIKGYVAGNTANAHNKFNQPQEALKYYSDAVKNYKEAESPLKTAVNYKRAAEVMADYNNPQKAKSLLKKALTYARQTDDVQLMKELNEALKS